MQGAGSFSLPYAFKTAGLSSGVVLTILLGFPYVAAGEMTSGQLIDCFIKLNFHINFSLREVLEKIPRMARMLEPIGRICELLKSEPKLEPSADSGSCVDCATAAELGELMRQCEVFEDSCGESRTRTLGKVGTLAHAAQLKHLSTADHQHLAIHDWRALDLSRLTYPVRAVFSSMLRPARFRGKIEFRGVHFAYPTELRKPVLQGLSFVVQPGEKVALVGPTGCGKSSCMSLLQRLYEPQRGTILIDDVPIGEYDVHYLRSRVVIVDQHTVLFSATIRDNITFGLEYDRERFERVAAWVGMRRREPHVRHAENAQIALQIAWKILDMG